MFYRVKPQMNIPDLSSARRATLFQIAAMIESGWRRSRRRRVEMDEFDGS